jgi:ribonuclease P/MRP protein subunit POP3
MPGVLGHSFQKKESDANLVQSDAISTPDRLAAVLVCRTTLPIPLHAHLPALVAVASDAQRQKPAIRLVSLPKTAETRLSKALHLPRVGIIGIADNCPHAASVMAYVRRHVPPLDLSK